MNSIIRCMVVQNPSSLTSIPQSLVRWLYSPIVQPPRYAVLGETLIYDVHGNPAEVLHIKTPNRCQIRENEVAVKWLLAPVNPADINTIEGKYPTKPQLPATPGNEGVGIVTSIGTNVNSLQIGDKVIPNTNNLGTWASIGVHKANNLHKVPPELGLVEASMLQVNPCTAYRMLNDFVKLHPGDTVIQNGANSAVGQMVIQLCKLWDFKTVNIIRDRPDLGATKKHLEDLGADIILLDNEIRTTKIFAEKQVPMPKLALNCVGGQNALNMARHLDQNGVMVTYGGMSREPLTLPVSLLIFKNISFKGFWMTAWTHAHSRHAARKTMLDELSHLFIQEKLRAPPHKLVPFKEYQEAVTNALSGEGRKNLKYILNMQDK